MADHRADPLFGKVPKSVPLENAPLVRVLGQVRFPTIIKISEESYISDFQEAIRGDYPLLQRELVQGLELSLAGQEIQHGLKDTVIWRFFSSDKTLRISLTGDAITLETTEYTNRHAFLNRLEFVLEKLQETINPSLVQRVGFRYINRIQGDDDLKILSDLVQPSLLNVQQPDLISRVDMSMTQILSETNEGRLNIHYGLLPPGYSHDPSMGPPVMEKNWTLDVDSYSTSGTDEEFETSKLRKDIDAVAARAYAFFRWCVTDKFLKHFGGNQ